MWEGIRTTHKTNIPGPPWVTSPWVRQTLDTVCKHTVTPLTCRTSNENHNSTKRRPMDDIREDTSRAPLLVFFPVKPRTHYMVSGRVEPRVQKGTSSRCKGPDSGVEVGGVIRVLTGGDVRRESREGEYLMIPEDQRG
jgi:hypothetical protein